MNNIFYKQTIRYKERMAAIIITAIYAVVGGLWILFSDRILAAVTESHEAFSKMQTIKGWFYVLATAFMLYGLIVYALKAIQHSEDALKESEDRFNRLIERAADVLFLHDANGNILNFNKTACSSLGYTPDELMKLSMADIVDLPSIEELREIWNQLPDTGPVTIFGTHRTKDGSTFPIEVRISLFDSKENQLILTFSRDISDRRRTEEELKRRRERELQIEAEAEEAKKQFYRGTIFSVTEGRLNLVSYDEVNAQLTPNTQDIALTSAADLTKVRKAASEIASNAGMPEDRIHSLIIALGEAAANAVKHANGGMVRIGIKEDKVQVCIQDNGKGMDTLILPKATLLRGYSTKPSMGLGYSLILSLVDTTYLATEKQGTWVLMEMYIEEPRQEIGLDLLPDNW